MSKPVLPFTIERLFAFIARDETGEEGICEFFDWIQRRWIPLIGSDWRRIESIKALAQKVADESGRPLRLCEFSVRREIESIEPKK